MLLRQLLVVAYTQAVAAESDGPDDALLTTGTGDGFGVSLVQAGGGRHDLTQRSIDLKMALSGPTLSYP